MLFLFVCYNQSVDIVWLIWRYAIACHTFILVWRPTRKWNEAFPNFNRRYPQSCQANGIIKIESHLVAFVGDFGNTYADKFCSWGQSTLSSMRKVSLDSHVRVQKIYQLIRVLEKPVNYSSTKEKHKSIQSVYCLGYNQLFCAIGFCYGFLNKLRHNMKITGLIIHPAKVHPDQQSQTNFFLMHASRQCLMLKQHGHAST